MAEFYTRQKHQVNDLKNTFISGFYMKDLSICDELIDYFEKSDNQQEGVLGPNKVIKWAKDSIDVPVYLWEDIPVYKKYRHELQEQLHNYIQQYPVLNETSPWGINKACNIQKYKPGGGFKKIHFERDSATNSSRFLVFMTYLNDVKDGGGTKWINQDVEIKAEKGLTVFWPTEWTHTHVGVVSPTQTKYIITGWYNYID